MRRLAPYSPAVGVAVVDGTAPLTKERDMSSTYQVDAAMLGDGFDVSDVEPFCEILQEMVGDDVVIEPITDSWNGARADDGPDSGEVLDAHWFAAMDQYTS
jgi:hypothetical protein